MKLLRYAGHFFTGRKVDADRHGRVGHRSARGPEAASAAKIIDEAEARAILEDAAAAHRNATPLVDAAAHDGAATLIEVIISGGNSGRRA